MSGFNVFHTYGSRAARIDHVRATASMSLLPMAHVSDFHFPYFDNITNNSPPTEQEIRSRWADLGGVDGKQKLSN
jgi:hypothetical protein